MTSNRDDAVEELLAALTLEEKCRMVSGADAWSIRGCERLEIPDWRVSDGPVGVRGRAMGEGLVLPCPSAMGASWDTELLRELGAALGQEAVDREVDVVLAPTMNLHRSPRGGRHFEAFSEDPELTARLAVAYIEGVQGEGVAACAKHFVANDQEHERTTIDVRVDERTLREVYLRPFEASVRDGGVRTVMAAYNYVNGEHACSNAKLLQRILKDEWGFDGVAMSDWDAMKDTVAPARHGLDLEMPGPGRWWGDSKLSAAVRDGKVDEADLDDKVRRVLHLLAWRDRLPGRTATAGEKSVDRPEHRALARRAAAAGTVLVKNDGVLPLAAGASVALIGPGAARTAQLGGGSALLRPHRRVSVLDALRGRWDGEVTYAQGVDIRRGGSALNPGWVGPGGVRAEVFVGTGFEGELLRDEQRPGVMNYWLEDTFPDGVDQLSARLSFTMTPDRSGPHALVAKGYGNTTLLLDGEPVATNEVDSFPVGLGIRGGAGAVDLEAGRPYEVVLEHLPISEPWKVVVADVGVLFAPDREALLVEAERVAAAADVAVVVVGSSDEWESEGSDRGTLELPAGQDELIARVLAANPRTVVVLNCGSPVLMPWLGDVPAALVAWYPGQEGGDAIADVLVGDAEPGGRMPTTWAVAERDTPSFLHYPGEAGEVRYGEELHVGHRWYDARGITPLVPFGHGGSYTTFEWGVATITGTDRAPVVEVPVTNTGDRRGSEVVQLYLAALDPPVLRPPKQLAGFAKVHLSPGERGVARIALDERAFARWDVTEHAWVVDPGSYELLLAASAVDVRMRLTHSLA
jgi:beta-glucosidase